MPTNVKQALSYARSAATARAKASRLADLASKYPRFAAQARRAAWAAECAERIAEEHAGIASELAQWRRKPT